jgi:integrase/recombinase XerD
MESLEKPFFVTIFATCRESYLFKMKNSLFDTNDFWATDPLTPFKAFIASAEFVELGRRVPAYRDPGKSVEPLRPATIQVYTLMFGKFHRWMRDHGKTLFTVDDADILQFLNSRAVDESRTGGQLKSTIRVKYVRLLERIFQHLEVAPNPAQSTAFQIYKTAGASGKDLDMVVMDTSQQQAFMDALPVANDTPAGWKRRRDRAMQALMLGAGLTVAEAMHAKTRDVGALDASGSLPVTVRPESNHSTTREHRTLLRPFAVAEVMQWMDERKKLDIPGQLLFPASLATGKPLDKATVYRQVKKTFARAGLEMPRQGGRTLRNTFAVRELENESVELVGELLGLERRRSTEYYLDAARKKMKPQGLF